MSSSWSVKGKGKAVLRPSQIQAKGFDDSPLWNHVKVTGGATGGGGNRHWMCNYCNKKVTGSYPKEVPFKDALKMKLVLATSNLQAKDNPTPWKEKIQSTYQFKFPNVHTVEGSFSQNASRHMLQASSQAS
ncbi:hypothetical protein RJ639_028430 [Escallonia herrerae]|uniref:Uncharacterized protein n=1 Tax=Escallonia herrerae TaxID=1293975 RepID=A0AA88XDA5_9ASTE|nr:hypothetical protein RJ639_028430 [Escallonia herrerae]